MNDLWSQRWPDRPSHSVSQRQTRHRWHKSSKVVTETSLLQYINTPPPSGQCQSSTRSHCLFLSQKRLRRPDRWNHNRCHPRRRDLGHSARAPASKTGSTICTNCLTSYGLFTKRFAGAPGCKRSRASKECPVETSNLTLGLIWSSSSYNSHSGPFWAHSGVFSEGINRMISLTIFL